MNPLELLRRRRADRQAGSGTAYWQLIADIASSKERSDAETAKLAKQLDELATELGHDVDSVAAHVALQRELDELGDPEGRATEMLRLRDEAHNTMQAYGEEWSAQVLEHERRAEELTVAWNLAGQRLVENTRKIDRTRELRRELAAAGCPGMESDL